MISAFSALVAAGWAAVCLAGGVDSGDVHVTAAGAATACAAAVLAGTVRPPETLPWFAPAGVLVLPVPVAWAASGESAAGLVVCLAPLAAAAAIGRTRIPRTALAAFIGAVSVAAGIVVSSGGLRPFELAPDGSGAATLLVAGGALLAVAAMVAPDGDVLRLVAVPGLVIALAAVPEAPDRGVVVVAAAAAVVAAVLLRRPPVALALLAVAAAAFPAAAPAPRLLAAAAVLAVAVSVPLVTALAALPGLVTLASVLAGTSVSLQSTFLAAGALVVLASMTSGVSSPRRPDVTALPALALAGWLVLLPTTWRWAGPPSSAVATFEDGALEALAAGLVVAVSGLVLARLRESPGRRVEPASL